MEIHQIQAQIKQARLNAGLTQEALATKIGSYKYVISNIEAGKANPTLETLLKICKALDKTLTLS